MHLALLHVSNFGVVIIVEVVFIVEAVSIFWFVFILVGAKKKWGVVGFFVKGSKIFFWEGRLKKIFREGVGWGENRIDLI